MAKIRGTSDGDRLFGTDGKDLIIGRGGNDFIQGNGGDDRISGAGQISGGKGNDSYFLVRAMIDGWLSGNFFTDVDLGPGRDLAVYTDHDAVSGITNYGFGIDMDLGPGKDTIIYGAKPFADVQTLGTGADTAYILSDSTGGGGSGGVRLSLGGESIFAGDTDRQRDKVHLDVNAPRTELYLFGENDRIILYGSEMSLEDIRLRTSFSSSAETSLTITFDNGNLLEIHKTWSGHLRSSNFEIVERELKVREKVLVEDGAQLQDALFLSGADNFAKANGNAVFAGAGDDTLRGDGRNDMLYGDSGDDRLLGRDGRDLLDGGTGDDSFYGGDGRDTIHTGAGRDFVDAGAGNDVIVFSRGGGLMKGGNGRDRFKLDDSLIASDPVTRLKGGAGRDVFEVEGASFFPELHILDFRPGIDRIALDERAGWTRADEAAYLERMVERIGTLDKSAGDPFSGAYIDYGGLDLYLRGVSPDRLDVSDFFFV